ncbi:BDR-repeat family protein [Elysia marginata]|uniref:BDR-repeat family protein n=1 Tax=Elysia marginata TaxID=1093978 RepID=A0AAV4G1J1_9GAST|nr:BDR-repeat family protein [Elysia marginata]
MTQSLFDELKKIGIDEALAAKVSASLDPDYNASKKDVLLMQQAMMQLQMRMDERYHEMNKAFDARFNAMSKESDVRYHELNNKIESVNHELNNKIESVKTEMHQGFADIRTELAGINRQYVITFGGLFMTIITVFLVNLYFNL